MNTQHTTPSLSPELERLAQKRASARLGAHQGRLWPIAPALGWGLGLFMHGLRVFAMGQGSALRERLVQKERERLLAMATHR